MRVSSMRASSGAPMIPVVSGVSARAKKTTSDPESTSSSAVTGTVRVAPGTGSAFRRTTVVSTLKGASCSRSTDVIPPPPRMVTRWS